MAGSTRWSFAAGMLVAFGMSAAFGSFSLTRAAQAGPSAHTRLDRETFHSTVDDVLDRYVEPVDESALLARGLKHMIGGLDPHSHYVTADERARLRAAAREASTGLWGWLDDAGGQRSIEVVAVDPDSPAARADLRPGDHILAIGSRAAESLEHQAELEAALRGPAGATLGLTVQRAGDPGPTRVELELEALSTTPVEASLVAGDLPGRKLAWLRIRAFRAGVGQAVQARLAELRRAAGGEGLAGIVLDLRNNPGGEVDEALLVADLFIEEGVLTRTRGRGGKILREERAHARNTDRETPVVVLQDRHTASASELLAVALREHGRATLVGERSYGKGTVQQVIGLRDGSLLALTIARYFSPRDHVIDGKGVGADVAVDPDDTAAVRRAVLAAFAVRPPSP